MAQYTPHPDCASKLLTGWRWLSINDLWQIFARDGLPFSLKSLVCNEKGCRQGRWQHSTTSQQYLKNHEDGATRITNKNAFIGYMTGYRPCDTEFGYFADEGCFCPANLFWAPSKDCIPQKAN